MRWKEVGIALITMVGAALANLNMLPIDDNVRNIINFCCLVILSLNHSVVSSKPNA
jgi:hypothetical protein